MIILQPLSDGPTLKLNDVRKGVKVMCVAENKGGRTERPFTLFVAGPGSAPENVQLNNDKPATIGVTWDPPTITNGNVTKYIVYYTPLDDQVLYSVSIWIDQSFNYRIRLLKWDKCRTNQSTNGWHNTLLLMIQ